MYLLHPFRGFDVVLDTNLLLLFVAGSVDPALIRRWRRTNTYFGSSEYELLLDCLKCFAKRITTPAILTETSHFLEELTNDYEQVAIKKLRETVSQSEEHHVSAMRVLEHRAMLPLGFTDTSQLVLAEDAITRVCLLSVDTPLVHWAQKHSLPAINFNHLRAGL